jgi:AraC-like DNA-binding protein
MTRFAPGAQVAALVRGFTVVETDAEATRTLIPEPGLVLGFRYGGHARQLDGSPGRLPNAVLTGLRTSARRMFTSAGGGVILATFHEAGAAQFLTQPLHELFGESVALDQLLPRAEVERAAARIAAAPDHAARMAIFEQFLLQRRRPGPPDPLVPAAVRAIRESRGSIRVGALAAELGVGIDSLEKRFRHAVGATPKQLASIIRLRHAVESHRPGASLTRLSLEAGYFDQSHFIREFRAIVGLPPTRFFRDVDHC